MIGTTGSAAVGIAGGIGGVASSGARAVGGRAGAAGSGVGLGGIITITIG